MTIFVSFKKEINFFFKVYMNFKQTQKNLIQEKNLQMIFHFFTEAEKQARKQKKKKVFLN